MSIKVITEPSIYLVAKTGPGLDSDKFLADHGVPDWRSSSEKPVEILPELGGRLCYMSFAKPRPGGNAAYLKHILEVQHGSVLEHSSLSFIFAGVSRSLTHEIVRHRAGMGYSQLSQRFVDESDVAFVLPPAIPADPDYRAYRVWLNLCTSALDQYSVLADAVSAVLPLDGDRTARRKAAREAARSVLPNCTETKILVTGNCRAWRNFLEQRGAPGADAEIRRLALTLLPRLVEEAGAIFGDYEVKTTDDGVKCIDTPHRKV